MKTENWIPKAYFLYIPFRMLAILPGHVPNAAGFSFGRDGVDLGYPKYISTY